MSLPLLLARNLTKIPDTFTGSEIAIKVAWQHVPCPKNGAAPYIPVFDAENVQNFVKDEKLDRAAFRRLYLDPKTLKGCDPTGVKLPMGETAYHRNQFFWFQSKKGETVNVHGGPPEIERGDYYFAVGLHIITREQEQWVWATYWLNDRPNAKGVEGRPDIIKFGKGTMFAMNIGLDSNQPIFNPYLEGSLPGGYKSNCLHCHSRAAVVLEGGQLHCKIPLPGHGPATPGPDAGSLATSFLWTLPRYAVPGGCQLSRPHPNE